MLKLHVQRIKIIHTLLVLANYDCGHWESLVKILNCVLKQIVSNLLYDDRLIDETNDKHTYYK